MRPARPAADSSRRAYSPLAAALAAALATSTVAAPRDARACAVAPIEGRAVQIATEEALIVWNAATRTEHFVRRASFRTDAPDFGFLVPTPSRPALAEAPDVAFARLAAAVAPAYEYVSEPGSVVPGACCLTPWMLSRGASDRAIETGAVRVIDSRRVAGYDAVVLEADDPNALAAWLREHGYASPPALAAWLRPYVDARWKITAFRVALGGDGGAAAHDATSAVRMTFETERPFFPYREPADQRTGPAAASGPRRLVVYFFGEARYEGAIGAGRAPWPGEVTYAQPVGAPMAFLAGVIPLVNIPTGPVWLTAFDDRSSPRPGVDDLFFSPAPPERRAPVRPPPVRVVTRKPDIPIPLDLVLIAIAIPLWIRRRRRLRAATKG